MKKDFLQQIPAVENPFLYNLIRMEKAVFRQTGKMKSAIAFRFCVEVGQRKETVHLKRVKIGA